MGDFGEALGTVVEGGLYSRAVEPKRGRDRQHGHAHESACLNCGTELVGPHCHACGQHAHVHRTIGAFMHDLLHGVLHADGKTLRTLPLLAWKPGELTRRYIEGERARFVQPDGIVPVLGVPDVRGLPARRDCPAGQTSDRRFRWAR